jgi:hypothetical protein
VQPEGRAGRFRGDREEIGEQGSRKRLPFLFGAQRKENAPVVVGATDWGAYAAHRGIGEDREVRDKLATRCRQERKGWVEALL